MNNEDTPPVMRDEHEARAPMSHLEGARARGQLGPGSIVMGMFELVKRLGEGTYATAYLAKQLGMDRRAVVKIAHPNLVRGRGADVLRKRFEVEVRASTRVEHPCVVTIYSAGEVHGAPAIAMEYVPGQTLEEFLSSSGPLTERTFLEVFQRLSSALAALHAAHIVHRDISPRNIIVQVPRSGQLAPKLLDFGAAQLDGATQYAVGPIGTPQFMAPEILRGETSDAVDIFSMGQLMWWAATGELLIPSHCSQFEVFEHLSRMERAPEIAGEMLQLSPALRELIQHTLSPDPEQRPSASEISGALARCSLSPSLVDSYPPRSRSGAVRAGCGDLEVLLLTYPAVPESLPYEALPERGVDVHRCDLRVWRKRYVSLDRFDLVLMPMARGGDEVLREGVIEVIEAREEVKTNIELHAYSTARFSRDVLGDMGIGEVWALPQDAGAMRACVVGLASLLEPGHPALDQDMLFRSLEEDSEFARSMIDEFTGHMPEWLLELEEALELKNRAKIFTLCGELSSRAMSVGAENILAITRELCALPGSHYSSRGEALLAELEREYMVIFRELGAFGER